MTLYAYVICQVQIHFAKLCKSILLYEYCQVGFTKISLVHIAKLLIPRYQGHVPK
jgi:hypothetical protein